MGRRGAVLIGGAMLCAACSHPHHFPQVLTPATTTSTIASTIPSTTSPASSTTTTTTSTTSPRTTTSTVPRATTTTVATVGPFGRHPPTGWVYIVTRPTSAAPELLAEDLATGAVRDLGQGDAPIPSPDRSKVMWQTTTAQNQTLIVVAGAGGQAPDTLSAPPSSFLFDVVWSPDGRRLAFASNVTGSSDTNDNEVVVENADGAGRRVVTSGARVRLFVPDGRKVAWSPDGTRIAFITAGLTGNDAAIEVADATTGAITKLTTSDGYNDLWWTPDSTALIAVDMTTFQVVRVAADGSGRRPLTQGDTDLVRAALSPDGSGVAFLPGQGTLTVVDVDGSGRRDLAAGVQSFASPWWSADSRWLLYVNVGSGLTGPVIAVNVGTGASVVIRSGDFGDAAW